MTRRIVQSLALAFAISAVAIAASCTGHGKMCAVCQREECGNLTFTIGLKSGKNVENCCARCGLRYIERERPEVASLAVRDFETAGTLDARAAFYVEGSDVTPCSSMHGATPPKDERGCCMSSVYDRCLPSVLAFRARDRAEGFAREHGGIVKTLAQLRSSRGAAPAGTSPGG